MCLSVCLSAALYLIDSRWIIDQLYILFSAFFCFLYLLDPLISLFSTSFLSFFIQFPFPSFPFYIYTCMHTYRCCCCHCCHCHNNHVYLPTYYLTTLPPTYLSINNQSVNSFYGLQHAQLAIYLSPLS
ncbi:hypothetical protein BDW42DRAFT_181901 [Aspergillus taichungensis]|uniref:Uncharacterized protein n=1 Tax=Aspergillus taichungensis TaxID=482145 RepID=A0A2J5HD92_9EURO|nr:hypothetical protein BDW42DRAFT_181901 [Aspergillus taichungensis]